MFELEGKVCLITGGLSGIGLACVKELMKNRVRAVAIIDLNERTGLELLGKIKDDDNNNAIFIKTDVRDKKQVDDAFKKTVAEFGNVDVLINNAGIYNEQQWETMVEVNLNGFINGNLLAFEDYIPKYKSGSEGVIVNICSIASVNIRGNHPVYTATKFGVLGLSRSLGLNEHYERTKVKVISVCPGMTDTTMIAMLEKCALNEHYADIFRKEKPLLSMQPTSHVGKTVVDVIKNGKTGSVWVVENNEEAYELVFPSRQEMRKTC